MERDFSRWMDLFCPSLFKDKKVGIIWAGWIGSNSAYALSKMWIHCKVCDFDEVDTVNTSSQFYSMTQLWKPKVEMLKENILNMADEQIEIINDKYKPEYFEDCQVLVLALDSLEVRKQVIETCKNEQFILDTRMLGKVSQINTLYWFQRKTWLEKERDENADKDNEWTRCTEKAIAFWALGMASLVGALVSDFFNNQVKPIAERKEIKYQYLLDLDNFKLYTFNS